MKYRFILACWLLVWTAAAAWSAPAPSKTTVSLELKQTSLHQALAILFDQLGLQYTIEAGVYDPPITMKVREIPFEEALRAMLRLVNVTGSVPITYTRVGDLYQIGYRRASPAPEATAAEPGPARQK